MIILLIFIVIILLLFTTITKEKFDNRSIATYPQYKPLSAFINAARSLETTNTKYKTVKYNTLTIFNQFVQNNYKNLEKYNKKINIDKIIKKND